MKRIQRPQPAPLTLVVFALLISACRASALPPPREILPPPSQTAIAPTATPTHAPSCTADPARTYTLELVPPNPRGGESVSFRATGLPPGPYGLWITAGGDTGVRAAVASVGADGVISGGFVLPPDEGGFCVYAIVDQHGSIARSKPFVTRPSLLSPGRCNSLPKVTAGGAALRLSVISIDPVVIRGTAERTSERTPLIDGSGLAVAASLSFGSNRDGVVMTNLVTIATNGSLSFDLVLPQRAAWSGLCVDVQVLVNGPGGAYADGRLDYP